MSFESPYCDICHELGITLTLVCFVSIVLSTCIISIRVLLLFQLRKKI